ncbi:hypothetical protein CSC81_18955, partial [Tenacibaculum discolor]
GANQSDALLLRHIGSSDCPVRRPAHHGDQRAGGDRLRRGDRKPASNHERANVRHGRDVDSLCALRP